MSIKMSNPAPFDVATAALEHLELLNRSNQNPLEIAAQFRTLLRSRKPHSANTDYTYADYISADATLRRQGRFYKSPASRPKSSAVKMEHLSFDESSHELSKCSNVVSSTEDMCMDSGISSEYSSSPSLPKSSMERDTFQYPTVSWRQLRERQNEQRLNKVKEFISTRLQPSCSPSVEITDSTLTSLTSTCATLDSYAYSNPFRSRTTMKESISIDNFLARSRSDSSSASIRTPSISPISCARPTYTITRLDPSAISNNNEDILVPIADCNLIIRHKAHARAKRLSHFDDELFRRHAEETVYI